MNNLRSRTLDSDSLPLGAKLGFSNASSLRIVSTTLALILASAAQAQTPATTARPSTTDVKSDEVKLEKFEVTGSRIKRLDTETPAPVVTFSKAEITQSGFTSLGDFVQSLPFNTGSTNSIVQTASFTRGAATVNPRGLGSNRFLVLINGRRSVGYALTNSNNQSVFDFNSIPLAAIDSIDYLKDGASAIYGSDAVTGVMDIKLKRNYSGLQSEVFAGNTLGHDTFNRQGSVLVGAQTGKTSIVVVGSYAGANDNFVKDYDRSKTTDYSSAAPKGINQNSSFNFPANVTLTAAQAAAAGYTTGAGIYVISGGTPTANPNKTQFSRVAAPSNANRYDFAQTYQLFPPYDYYGVYTNLRHEVSDKFYIFGEIIYSNNQTNFSFTPSVVQSIANVGTGPTGLLNIPPSNPYNPFGVDITNFSYRTNFTRATALNPFGPSDNPDVVNRLFTVSNSNYSNRAEMFDVGVTGSLFELPGGDVGIAGGSELRKEVIVQDPDTAAFVGSGGGTPYRGDRDTFSAYVEATMPFTRQIEVQVAGRYEDYSDFGTTFKPKIGAKFKLPSTKFVDVLVRASFSQSFKAPDLGRLYTASTVGFSANVRQDPKRPQDVPTQLRIVTSGNPNLTPEEADIYYAGAVFDIKAVKGLSVAIDYFQFEIDDVISAPSDTTLLAREDQFPGAVVRDSTQGNPGPILFIRRIPFNVAKQWYEGMDFEVKYDLRDTRFGNFRFTANATRTLSVKSNSGIANSDGSLPADFENVGLYNNPKWNGTFGSSWSYKDFGAALRVNYIGAYFNDAYTAAGWGENAVTTVNTSFSYKGFWDTTVTLGVNNLLDKEPPFNGYETSSYDQGTYGAVGLGRFVYIRLQREF